MFSGKRKWLPALAAALVILIVLFAVFGEPLLMHIFPEAVLSEALSDTVQKLEARFQDSPLQILAEGYDEEGRYEASASLETGSRLFQKLTMDLGLAVDIQAHRLTAEGSANADGIGLDIKAYLDQNYAAATSGNLMKGNYYGIQYDTFSSDIRNFTLLNMLIGSDTIGSWEQSVASVQSFMSREYTLPQLPEYSESDTRLLMAAILRLRTDVTKTRTRVGGSYLDCYRITYAAEGEEAREILRYLMDDPKDDCSISVSFYLCDRVLVKAELTASSGEDELWYLLTLGQNAEEDDLSLAMEECTAGMESSHEIILQTAESQDHFLETIQVDDTVISYTWYPETGAMALSLPERNTVNLILAETKNGFRIQTEDFGTLIGMEWSSPIVCTMTVSQGDAITPPEYKPLGQWALEDLMLLLRGFGGILGIPGY